MPTQPKDELTAEEIRCESARAFLKNRVKEFEIFTPFGLNKLPFVLYHEVSRVMEDYAQLTLQEINTEMEILKAIQCLFLELPESIAKDVQGKFVAYHKQNQSALKAKEEQIKKLENTIKAMVENIAKYP